MFSEIDYLEHVRFLDASKINHSFPTKDCHIFQIFFPRFYLWLWKSMARLVYKDRLTSRETRWDKATLKAFMVVLESKQLYPTVPSCYHHLSIVLLEVR